MDAPCGATEPQPALTVRSISALSEVEPLDWDRVANPDGEEFDPFLSWNFLQALEESGCVSEENGWIPRHLLVQDTNGHLLGAMPLYVKTHSQGEYVFDHAWANAFEGAGGQYYPKLLTAIPFTPVTGRRVLAGRTDIQHALIAAASQTAKQWDLSSWHVNFPTQQHYDACGEAGLLRRIDRQFVWHNRGYYSYDDFLADLSSRKRKALKRERREAIADIEIEHLNGAHLSPEHWDVFFACYQETGSRKWGTPYLNRKFFDLIHQRMSHQIVLVLAKSEGRYIAAALNFVGSDALFGRYWGRLDDRPHLHFELCYHQAIDIAIERGLSRVEAGAQGEHKLARGYRPVPVYSAHWLVDEGFRDAVDRYLIEERRTIEHDIAVLNAESPYKTEPPSS
jgi:predicted N-acyltransferase